MFHKKKQVLRSLLLAFFILSIICSMSFKTGLAEEKAYVVEDGITYGKGGDVDLKLDLARPAIGNGPFPALVFIFGGWWATSSREAYSFAITQAAQHGYVAVTVDYRLTNVRENGKVKYPFPAQIHDVKCTVRWLRANAEKYRIDPNRIGAIGWSSGGHLALLLGLTNLPDGLEGECGNMNYSSRVQAVVSLAGNTELISLYNEQIDAQYYIGNLLGGAPDKVSEQYKKASPITYVSKDDPPVLTIHGDQDWVLPLKQAELLDKKMKEVGASHTLIGKKDRGHVDFFVMTMQYGTSLKSI